MIIICCVLSFSVAPKIDRRCLRNIKVKEGEPIALDVKVSGEPAPDCTWTLNNKSVTNTSNLKSIYFFHNVNLFINNNFDDIFF